MFGPASGNLLAGNKAAVSKTETIAEVVVKKPEPRKPAGNLLF
jgi:hypothetical protein